jgi:hypothetical protein
MEKKARKIFGGTPRRSSRHTNAPRHTGWETLFYILTMQKPMLVNYLKCVDKNTALVLKIVIMYNTANLLY